MSCGPRTGAYNQSRKLLHDFLADETTLASAARAYRASRAGGGEQHGGKDDAGWNATIKGGLDPLATTVLISIGAAIVAAVFLPFVGLPARAAWPWCATSVLIHLVYFAALIESYRAGDMGQVYPIARGSAPLMTAVVTRWPVADGM